MNSKLVRLILEARWGFAVVENSLWEAVPTFFRNLDQLLLDSTGERLPLQAAPIRFASWMGGDRDVSIREIFLKHQPIRTTECTFIVDRCILNK